jgi:hypothetical protein
MYEEVGRRGKLVHGCKLPATLEQKEWLMDLKLSDLCSMLPLHGSHRVKFICFRKLTET